MTDEISSFHRVPDQLLVCGIVSCSIICTHSFIYFKSNLFNSIWPQTTGRTFFVAERWFTSKKKVSESVGIRTHKDLGGKNHWLLEAFHKLRKN